jgi:hypothetical protein
MSNTLRATSMLKSTAASELIWVATIVMIGSVGGSRMPAQLSPLASAPHVALGSPVARSLECRRGCNQCHTQRVAIPPCASLVHVIG